MIGTIVFVLAFIALGLGVVGAAMRSGRRKKPESAGPSRAEQRVTLAATGLVTLAIGIGIPAFVMVDNSNSSAEDGPGGVELTEGQVSGRQLFAQNCSTCHSLAGSRAVGRVGPDLDQMRPPVELTLDAIEKGRARGQGQMPAGLLGGQDARNVAEYVAAVAGR